MKSKSQTQYHEKTKLYTLVNLTNPIE